jgi:hypothetical protein
MITQNLPARPVGRRDPVFTGADRKVLEPGVRDFRVHDVNVTIRLTLLGWQLATFKVDLDLGKFGDDTPRQRPFDRACKHLSRHWVNAMMS